MAMKSRALGRKGVVVGDRVRLVGDTSGVDGSLARIVTVDERVTVLRRTADDDDPVERVIVANADQLVIVTSLADPEPRQGLVDRALVAAYDAGMDPLLCLTKADLADPEPLLASYRPLGVPYVVTQRGADLTEIRDRLAGRTSVLLGHSGVGKSTLVNALVPGRRPRGRRGQRGHRSRAAHLDQRLMLALPGGGWIVDTPGIRSFGLAHVDPDQLIEAFPDLARPHRGLPAGVHARRGRAGVRARRGDRACRLERVRSFRRLLASREAGERLLSACFWLALPDRPGAGVAGEDDQHQHRHRGQREQHHQRLLQSGHACLTVGAAREPGDVGPQRERHDHQRRKDPHRDHQPLAPLLVGVHERASPACGPP